MGHKSLNYLNEDEDPLAGGNGTPTHLPQEPPAKRARREEVTQFNVSRNRGFHFNRFLFNGLTGSREKRLRRWEGVFCQFFTKALSPKN
jgi:hypothetical protein